jgi:hypothetical protein
MNLWQAARFFLVVPVVSHAMLWGLLAVVVAGCVAIGVHPDLARDAMTPLLLLQIFACASGFRVPARRGHYDLLLTSGARRGAIGLAHWGMSAFPGALAWAALAATERAAGGHSLVASGTLTAMAFASTAPWALAMPLPRMSGAILWLVVSISLSAVGPEAAPPVLSSLLPWALVGVPLTGTMAVAAVTLVAFGIGSVAAAIQLIRLMDIPLEAAQ